MSAGGVVQRINEFPDLIQANIINDETAYTKEFDKIRTYRNYYGEAFKACRYMRLPFGAVPPGTGCAAAIQSDDSATSISKPTDFFWYSTPDAQV